MMSCKRDQSRRRPPCRSRRRHAGRRRAGSWKSHSPFRHHNVDEGLPYEGSDTRISSRQRNASRSLGVCIDGARADVARRAGGSRGGRLAACRPSDWRLGDGCPGFFEFERCRVDAESQSRRRRPIVEDVAEMASAAAAHDFDAQHSLAAVVPRRNTPDVQRPPETGPAGARIKLGIGAEQRRITADAVVRSPLVAVPVFAREWPLCAFSPRHIEL